jgi:hypothetical protein
MAWAAAAAAPAAFGSSELCCVLCSPGQPPAGPQAPPAAASTLRAGNWPLLQAGAGARASRRPGHRCTGRFLCWHGATPAHGGEPLAHVEATAAGAGRLCGRRLHRPEGHAVRRGHGQRGHGAAVDGVRVCPQQLAAGAERARQGARGGRLPRRQSNARPPAAPARDGGRRLWHRHWRQLPRRKRHRLHDVRRQRAERRRRAVCSVPRCGHGLGGGPGAGFRQPDRPQVHPDGQVVPHGGRGRPAAGQV